MAKSYLGYVQQDDPQVLDWGALSGAIGDVAKEAIGTRGREREAFNSVRESNESKINSYEIGQSQTLNNLVLDGADQIRSLMYEWNQAANRGEMTRAEYTKRQNNIELYWSNLANSAKSFDERTMQSLTRQQPGDDGFIPGSNMELYINKKHSEIANLKNRSIYTNPETGVIYLVERDENGDIKEQVDVRQMNNPGNTIDNRVNLEAAVQKGTENWGDWSQFKEGIRGSSETISDPRQNPAFISAKNSLIESIMSNPRSTASVLSDNSSGGYTFYSSEAEKWQLIQDQMIKEQRVAAEAGTAFSEEEFVKNQESKMILLERDETGVYQPSLTPQQVKDARQTVSDAIEMHVGFEKTGTVKRAPSGGGGGGPAVSNTAEGNVNYSLYKELTNAWALVKSDPEASAARLTNASGGKYVFEWVRGKGVAVYEVSASSDGVEDKKKQAVISSGVTDLRNLAPYFFGPGTGANGTRGAYEEFDVQKQAYTQDKKKKSTGSGGAAPKTQAEFDAQWAKLKPGQSLTGPDGKKYTK